MSNGTMYVITELDFKVNNCYNNAIKILSGHNVQYKISLIGVTW